MMVTASAATGAVSHDGPDWASIDWQEAERVVRRLQARIVQACKAGHAAPPSTGEASEGLEPCAGTTGTHGSERAERWQHRSATRLQPAATRSA